MNMPTILAALTISFSVPDKPEWYQHYEPVPYANTHISDLLITADTYADERRALMRIYDLSEHTPIDASVDAMDKATAMGWLAAFAVVVAGGLLAAAAAIRFTLAKDTDSYHERDIKAEEQHPDWPSKNWLT